MASRASSMTAQTVARVAGARAVAARTIATRSVAAFNVKSETLSPLYAFGGVHGSKSGQKTWRNKPLFRREVSFSFLFGDYASKSMDRWM